MDLCEENFEMRNSFFLIGSQYTNVISYQKGWGSHVVYWIIMSIRVNIIGHILYNTQHLEAL